MVLYAELIAPSWEEGVSTSNRSEQNEKIEAVL